MDFCIAQFELLSFTIEVEFPFISITFENKYSHSQVLIPLVGKLKGLIEHLPTQVKRFFHNNNNISIIITI